MSVKLYHNSVKRVAAVNKGVTAMPSERDCGTPHLKGGAKVAVRLIWRGNLRHSTLLRRFGLQVPFSAHRHGSSKLVHSALWRAQTVSMMLTIQHWYKSGTNSKTMFLPQPKYMILSALLLVEAAGVEPGLAPLVSVSC